MLIRKYSDHYRADAVGLKAKTYTLKVVGKSSGEKVTQSLALSSFPLNPFEPKTR